MITLSDYILEVISKFPFLLLLVQIFRVLYPEYCRFLQLLLPSISLLPSQLTGKCLVSPPWMFLSHYVSTAHQRVSMSHVDMLGAEASLHTGLDLCLEYFRAQSSIVKTVIQIYLAKLRKYYEVGFGHNTHDSSFYTGQSTSFPGDLSHQNYLSTSETFYSP